MTAYFIKKGFHVIYEKKKEKNKDLFIVDYNKIVNISACAICRHEIWINEYIQMRMIHVIKYFRVHSKTLGGFT